MYKFQSPSAEFIFLRTYARWVEEKSRRESYDETVDRVIGFLESERGSVVPAKVYKKIKQYMLSLEVLPSMRLVWTAGDAARSENLSIYNCSAIPLDSWESFSEVMYLLMVGSGATFSVRKQFIQKLPFIAPRSHARTPFTVPDNRKGWAESIKFLLVNEAAGVSVDFDYSLIRKKGARLKSFGGRASGPEPLAICHSFLKASIDAARERQLKSIECLDMACSVAEAVIVGGIRRSACLCAFDPDDQDMILAKSGNNFPIKRFMSNNSLVFEEKPSAAEFLQTWSMIAKNGTGEPGILNLGAMKKRCPERRDGSRLVMTNPCGEAILRNRGLCNLSSVILRNDDDLDDVLHKVETATWIGVIQATFTNFHVDNPDWKKNAEEERLLGVSLSGQMDAPNLITKDNLIAMKQKVLKTAKKASKIMGIPMPAATTVVKPEGTSSQLTDASSGMHERFAKYYIRRYRISTNDPLFRLLRDQGAPMVPEVGQEEATANTFVVEFPIKAPEGAILRSQKTALQQLEHYKLIQEFWCEQNASMTIYVRDSEWFSVGNWCYENWDFVSGLSFLPYEGGSYKLAPYEEIDEDHYLKLIKEFPKVDYSVLSVYEQEDNTEGAKTYACTGNACELK